MTNIVAVKSTVTRGRFLSVVGHLCYGLTSSENNAILGARVEPKTKLRKFHQMSYSVAGVLSCAGVISCVMYGSHAVVSRPREKGSTPYTRASM